MGYVIGVDVGGTFADFSVFSSETRRLLHYKHSFTPDDPSRSTVSGIHYILESEGIDPVAVEYLAHRATVATSMLIERCGAHMGLITTKGSGDLMEIGNQKRPSLHDPLKEKPESLTPSGLRCEAEERLLHDGSVKILLNEEDVRKAVRFFQKQNVTAIVVRTLFSFINPAHERRIKEIILEEYPGAYAFIPSEPISEFREYPRMSTTVLSAYLGPVMKKYTESFRNSVWGPGIIVAPYVIQSSDSIISIAKTVGCPIKTAISGLSAGVVGATCIGRQRGVDKVIMFDVGGTGVDISLIKNGKAQVSYERMVGGYPACIPIIDIITVGAGGGSIAAIGEGGVLRMGPRSVGAIPGPACYMRGGKNPTITDASILLGELNRHKTLGGRADVNQDPAYGAVQKKASGKSSLSVRDIMAGIISIVSSNMMRVIRAVSIERGYSVHEFTLTAFGSVGPLHAYEVTRELGITQVLLPPAPGTLYSLGLLMTDTWFDLSQSYTMIVAPQNLSEMNRISSQLTGEGDRILEDEGITRKDRAFFYSLDCRCERQNYEIAMKLPTREIIEEVLSGLVEQFHQKRECSYGYYDKKESIQIANYRVGVVDTIDRPDLSEYPVKENPQAPAPVEVHKVRPEGSSEYLDTNIYQCTRLPCGCTVSGLTITEQMDSTSIIPSGWQAYNDPFLNLIITYHGDETA